MPRLVSCYFAWPGHGDSYARLARVLRATAAEHCPGWSLEIVEIAVQPRPQHNASFDYNSQKLDWWTDLVLAAADGDELLIMDADMAILRPLDAIWAQPFDLAYTERVPKTPRLALNGGVIALRVSDRVRAAIVAFRDINRRMFGDHKYHQQWRRKYGGINQAAFGAALEGGVFGALQVLALPCPEWNCVQWSTFDSGVTRILHVKSDLRLAALRGGGSYAVRELAKLWQRLERQVGAAPAGAPPEMSLTEKVQFRVSKKLYDRYDHACLRHHVSLPDLLRAALAAHDEAAIEAIAHNARNSASYSSVV